MDLYPVVSEVLLITSGILLLILIFLQVSGKLEDRRFRKWYKKITRRGWMVIIIYIVLIFIGSGNRILKSVYEERIQTDRDSLIAVEIHKGVADRMKKINDSLYEAVSGSLLKFGLKMDTIADSIVKIGKGKKQRIAITTIEPFLEISALQEAFSNDSGKYYKVNVVSKNAPCTNFDIDAKLWLEYMDGIQKGFHFELLPKDARLNKETTVIRPFPMGNVENLKFIYLYITGSYTNLVGNIIYDMDELKYMDLTNEKRGNTFMGTQKQEIIKLLNSQKFEYVSQF